MPITEFQKRVLALLSINRTPDSHLAGAAAIHLSKRSSRTSHDLDLFHDSEQAVANAFAKDRSILEQNGYVLELVLSQPGFIRARIGKKEQGLLVDWAYDSAWRFMPPVALEGVGYVLHPVDLAVNKVLALGGREEVRDIVDVLYLNEHVLPMGALIWASVAKDPGLGCCSNCFCAKVKSVRKNCGVWT